MRAPDHPVGWIHSCLFDRCVDDHEDKVQSVREPYYYYIKQVQIGMSVPITILC
jgi:hypothetical protein